MEEFCDGAGECVGALGDPLSAAMHWCAGFGELSFEVMRPAAGKELSRGEFEAFARTRDESILGCSLQFFQFDLRQLLVAR